MPGIALPTFAQLADPARISGAGQHARLAAVGPDDPAPAEPVPRPLVQRRRPGRAAWRCRSTSSCRASSPASTRAIVVALGDRFPMIEAHKVLAAYGCLAPRLVTGQFDPTRDRAVWPSTGNYCRGGVAISRLMGCRGVAVLPGGHEPRAVRLARALGGRPGEDIIRTPGTESNVKEIYDTLPRARRAIPENVILNQFAEFGNHVAHYLATGAALAARLRVAAGATSRRSRLRAFVSATGSAGTIGAGDYLKERYGSLDRRRRGARVPDDALQRLRRAQHPGDRRQAHPAHPQRDEHRRRARGLRPRDRPARRPLRHRRRAASTCAGGAASPADVVARAARRSASRASATSSARSRPRSTSGSGRTTSSSTVATDGAAMYGSERELALAKYFPGGFDEVGGGGGLRRAPARRGDRPPARADARGARADLQPRLLHLGRAAGRLARGLRGAPRPGVLDADRTRAAEAGTS